MQRIENELNNITSFFDNLSEEEKLEFNKKQCKDAKDEVFSIMGDGLLGLA